MCFSAQASFIASGVLLLLSVGAVYLARKNMKMMLFAHIPFLFAIQQALEGITWLSFTHPAVAPFQTITTYSFLFFALFLWPAYIGPSLLVLETNAKRKTILTALSFIGLLLGTGLIIACFVGNTYAVPYGCNIMYSFEWPDILHIPGGLVYLLATAIPLFVSSIAYMWVLGIALIASYAIAYWYYYMAFVSVWCFFAAVLSGLVIFILWNNVRKK